MKPIIPDRWRIPAVLVAATLFYLIRYAIYAVMVPPGHYLVWPAKSQALSWFASAGAFFLIFISQRRTSRHLGAVVIALQVIKLPYFYLVSRWSSDAMLYAPDLFS